MQAALIFHLHQLNLRPLPQLLQQRGKTMEGETLAMKQLGLEISLLPIYGSELSTWSSQGVILLYNWEERKPGYGGTQMSLITSVLHQAHPTCGP